MYFSVLVVQALELKACYCNSMSGSVSVLKCTVVDLGRGGSD